MFIFDYCKLSNELKRNHTVHELDSGLGQGARLKSLYSQVNNHFKANG